MGQNEKIEHIKADLQLLDRMATVGPDSGMALYVLKNDLTLLLNSELEEVKKNGNSDKNPSRDD